MLFHKTYPGNPTNQAYPTNLGQSVFKLKPTQQMAGLYQIIQFIFYTLDSSASLGSGKGEELVKITFLL